MSMQSVLQLLEPGNRAALRRCIEQIHATQESCQHTFNPTIPQGWIDGQDCRVCNKCGSIEVARSAELQGWQPFPPSSENGYSDHVKQVAYKLDPECWVSYSGKPKNFKSYMETRRVASLKKAAALSATGGSNV
jgi:hypothetical protein